MEKWDKTPVDLEEIDTAGVTALRNKTAKGVRLFNVWATSCAPCVAEFPDLVKVSRQFDTRDFQFINISYDAPEESAKAKAFLEKRGAGLSAHRKDVVKAEGRKTNSYLYKGADTGELMKALDPEWPGGFPHTVLVGKDGEILWRHNGQIDPDALRAKIVEVLGPYYKP
jgi:thiol-disulfide isomerase/thioredoxin